MAAVAGVYSAHATLTTTTADTVTLSGDAHKAFCVVNRDSSVELFFRWDGTTAVAEADDTYIVLPLQSVTVEKGGGGDLVVSVVGNGNAYSVEMV